MKHVIIAVMVKPHGSLPRLNLEGNKGKKKKKKKHALFITWAIFPCSVPQLLHPEDPYRISVKPHNTQQKIKSGDLQLYDSVVRSGPFLEAVWKV
jgi:hypothetical protein